MSQRLLRTPPFIVTTVPLLGLSSQQAATCEQIIILKPFLSPLLLGSMAILNILDFTNIDYRIRRFQDEQKTWFQADRTCQEQNSNLIEIDSAEESAALLKVIQKYDLGSRAPDVWLGLTQFGDKGNWTLMSSVKRGQPPRFLNWETPVVFSSMPECATMKTSNGRWGASECSSTNVLFICEKSKPVKIARNEGKAEP